MIRALSTVLALLFVFMMTRAAHAGERPPPARIPLAVTASEAAALYEAQRLVCGEQRCRQGDREYPIGAFSHTEMTHARWILKVSRRQRSIATISLYVLTGLSAASGGVLLGVARDESATIAGGSLIGGAALTLTIGLLVQFLWKHPETSFEDAYNATLAEQLESRISTHPEVVIAAARAGYSPEQQECFDLFGDKVGRRFEKRLKRCLRNRRDR
jgi:hypothetical protein